MFFARALDDYVRRLGIDGAAPIPCVARSLTEDESRAVGRGHIGWAATVVLVFGLMFGGVALAAEPQPERLAWLGWGFAGLVLLAAVITWFKLRKRRGYRDPRLRVEIGPDEVAVVGPAGRDARPYGALTIIELLSGSTKSSRYFIGIVLDTRLGPIRLEDEWYSPGKAAAGAILKRMDELGLPLAPRS
jgi:hypothetical protein